MVEHLEPAVHTADHEDLTDCVLRCHIAVHLAFNLFSVQHLNALSELRWLLVDLCVFELKFVNPDMLIKNLLGSLHDSLGGEQGDICDGRAVQSLVFHLVEGDE